MKTFIQNFRDQHYLGEGFAWVKERERAKVFPQSVEALEFCLRHHIEGVELVLVDEHGGEIVRVPRN